MIKLQFTDLTSSTSASDKNQEQKGGTVIIHPQAANRLTIIELLAYHTVPIRLIASTLSEDKDLLTLAINEPGTPEHDAYYQGYMRQYIELKESIIKSAKNGSNPAQAELLKSLAELTSQLNG